jgi:hypothetical protein
LGIVSATPSRFQHTKRVSIPPDLQKLTTSQKSACKLAFTSKQRLATDFIARTRQPKSDMNQRQNYCAQSLPFPKSDTRFESSIPKPSSARPERRQPKSSGGGAVINGF